MRAFKQTLSLINWQTKHNRFHSIKTALIWTSSNRKYWITSAFSRRISIPSIGFCLFISNLSSRRNSFLWCKNAQCPKRLKIEREKFYPGPRIEPASPALCTPLSYTELKPIHDRIHLLQLSYLLFDLWTDNLCPWAARQVN